MNANILYSGNLNSKSSHNPALLNAFVEKLFDTLLNPESSQLSSNSNLNSNKIANSFYLLMNTLLPFQYIPIMHNIVPPTWNALFLYYLYAIEHNRQFVLLCNNMLHSADATNIDAFVRLWNDVYTESIKDQKYIIHLKNMFESYTDIDFIRQLKELFSFVISRDDFQQLSGEYKELFQQFTFLSTFFEDSITEDYVPLFFEIFILYFLISHFFTQLFPTAESIRAIPPEYQTTIQSLNIVSTVTKFNAAGRLMKKMLIAATAIHYPDYSADEVDTATNIQSFMNHLSQLSQFIFTNPACLLAYAESDGIIFPSQLFSILKHYSFVLSYQPAKKVADIDCIINISPIFTKYLTDQLLISPTVVPLFTLQKEAESGELAGINDIVLHIPSSPNVVVPVSLRMPALKIEQEVEGSIYLGYSIMYHDATIADSVPLPTDIFVYQQENHIFVAIQQKKVLEIRLLENGDYQVVKNDKPIATITKEVDEGGEIKWTCNFISMEWNYSDFLSICFVLYSLLAM